MESFKAPGRLPPPSDSLVIPITVVRSLILFMVSLAGLSGCDIGETPPRAEWQDCYQRAFLLHKKKQYSEAEKEYSRSLNIARKIGESTLMEASSLAGLGGVLAKSKKLETADECLEQAQKIFESNWDPERGGVNNRENATHLVETLVERASIKAATGNNKAATELLRQADRISDDVVVADGLKHRLLINLAKLLKADGNRREARKLIQAASLLDSPVDVRDENAAKLSARELLKSAELATSGANFDNAERLFKLALEKSRSRDTALTARILIGLSTVYDTQKRYDKAETSLSRAVKMIEAEADSEQRRDLLQASMERLASICMHRGKLEEARLAYLKAIELERVNPKRGDFRRHERRLIEALTMVLIRQENYKQAEKLVRERMEYEIEKYGRGRKKHGRRLADLAQIYSLDGQTERATECYKQSLEFLRTVKDLNPIEIIEVMEDYSAHLMKAGKTGDAKRVVNETQTLRHNLVN